MFEMLSYSTKIHCSRSFPAVSKSAFSCCSKLYEPGTNAGFLFSLNPAGVIQDLQDLPGF